MSHPVGERFAGTGASGDQQCRRRLYRRRDEVSLDEVERIVIYRREWCLSMLPAFEATYRL
jgi:hypothetical protein